MHTLIHKHVHIRKTYLTQAQQFTKTLQAPVSDSQHSNMDEDNSISFWVKITGSFKTESNRKKCGNIQMLIGRYPCKCDAKNHPHSNQKEWNKTKDITVVLNDLDYRWGWDRGESASSNRYHKFWPHKIIENRYQQNKFNRKQILTRNIETALESQGRCSLRRHFPLSIRHSISLSATSLNPLTRSFLFNFMDSEHGIISEPLMTRALKAT